MPPTRVERVPLSPMKKYSALVTCLLLPLFAGAQDNQPYLLNPAAIPAAKLEKQLARAMAAPIRTIVDKALPSPTGDAHDYISYGRYYWPDPAQPDGQPFLKKDGYPNTAQIEKGDRKLLEAWLDQVETFALGWSQLHRADAALRAGEWLRAWIITPATRLNPNFDYAQIRLGHDHNRGSASGLIDTRGLIRLVDAVRLLHGSPGLSAADEAAIKTWFSDYLHWLTTSRNGRLEHAAKNNHGSWYLAQAITIARFVGRDDEARAFAQEDLARIDGQIEPDGRQPLEIAREDGLTYSAFNLEAQLCAVRLAAPLGIDLWHHTTPRGGSLPKAIEYLRPFNAAPETWPHRQLTQPKPGFLAPLLEKAAELNASPRS